MGLTANRARLLVNPAAGRGAAKRWLPRFAEWALAAGVPWVATASRAHLEEEARRAVAEGVERLLVAGGDGTQHWVIQHLAGTATALGVLPVGSGNDLAGTLGIAPQPRAAFSQLLTAPIAPIDLGRVRGAGGERWFAGVAGVGFDSAVATYANEHLRWLRGSAIYAYGVVRALASFKPPYLELAAPGADFAGRVMLVAIGNTHRYGGGMAIAPDARPDDGQLDVVIVKHIPKLTLLRVFPRVYRGSHCQHPAVVNFRTPRLSLRLDGDCPLFGDGEPMLPAGPGALEIEVIPGALRVVAG